MKETETRLSGIDVDRKRVQTQIDELRTTDANRRRVDELRRQKEGQEHAFEVCYAF